MRRVLGLVSVIVLSAILSGCTVPATVTVASWALDGFSYVATKKSLTDHGLSYAAGMDCALYRIITTGRICHEYADEPTALAQAGDGEEVLAREEQELLAVLEDEPSVEDLENFETAAGGDDESSLEIAEVPQIPEIQEAPNESDLSPYSPRSLVRSGISLVELVVQKATFWR